MKKIDRLVMGAFVGPFIVTFSVVVFILLLQFLIKYLDEFVGKGIGANGAARPVNRVLKAAGNGTVIFRGDEQNSIHGCERVL